MGANSVTEAKTREPGSFTEEERKVLHSVAEIFSEKKDRDELRKLIDEGATLRELILAYRSQRRVVSTLKAIGGLVVLGGAVISVFKGAGFMPK
jgi:hypothetical protein